MRTKFEIDLAIWRSKYLLPILFGMCAIGCLVVIGKIHNHMVESRAQVYRLAVRDVTAFADFMRQAAPNSQVSAQADSVLARWQRLGDSLEITP